MAPSGLPRIDQIGIDAAVLLFTFGVSLLCSLLIACIPVFKYAGVRLSTGIREGGRALSHPANNTAPAASSSSFKSPWLSSYSSAPGS